MPNVCLSYSTTVEGHPDEGKVTVLDTLPSYDMLRALLVSHKVVMIVTDHFDQWFYWTRDESEVTLDFDHVIHTDSDMLTRLVIQRYQKALSA